MGYVIEYKSERGRAETGVYKTVEDAKNFMAQWEADESPEEVRPWSVLVQGSRDVVFRQD